MREHTGAGVGGVTGSSSSTDDAGRDSNAGHSGREEVASEASILAADVGLGVAGSAGSLRASSNALVGVVGLLVARAGDLVAASNAATIVHTA